MAGPEEESWAIDNVTVEAATTTSVSPVAQVPGVGFVFHPSFPNPVQSSTVFAYELFVPAEVSLSIYDGAGRQVALLVNQVDQAPGRYQVRWNGSGVDGSRVGPGVYYSRLLTPAGMQSNKVIVLP